MSVHQIAVRGFKSIQELDLELHSLNVLIGANGAGKSNFIGIFRLLNELSEENLQRFVGHSGGADALLHHGSKRTKEIFIRLGDGDNEYEASLEADVQDGLVFREEKAIFHGMHGEIPRSLGKGHRETKLTEHSLNAPIPRYTLQKMKTWKVYHFHDTSENARVKGTNDIGDNAFFRHDAENLAAFLYMLHQRHREHYERIVATIRLVAPFFRDFNLRPSPLNEEKIRLEWSERASDTYLNAHAFSDGTLRFICLATLLLQPTPPSTILIDEPELGLHPAAINVLTELFRSVTEHNYTPPQMIVSTQSVPLINQLTPEDIIVVDRKNDSSVFRRLTKNEIDGWLDEYSLGELWEKNVLGGRP